MINTVWMKEISAAVVEPVAWRQTDRRSISRLFATVKNECKYNMLLK